MSGKQTPADIPETKPPRATRKSLKLTKRTKVRQLNVNDVQSFRSDGKGIVDLKRRRRRSGSKRRRSGSRLRRSSSRKRSGRRRSGRRRSGRRHSTGDELGDNTDDSCSSTNNEDDDDNGDRIRRKTLHRPSNRNPGEDGTMDGGLDDGLGTSTSSGMDIMTGVRKRRRGSRKTTRRSRRGSKRRKSRSRLGRRRAENTDDAVSEMTDEGPPEAVEEHEGRPRSKRRTKQQPR